ncbi:hypothetical protein XENTR_v10009091 [Xenopus tropicalis]|nr:hypothetical protein XENTR_v10009091 [Xenopus tropicalis]
MEKQAHHIVAERSIIRARANNLQGVVENQKNDIKHMQEIYNSQLEEQRQEFSKQKNDLQNTISTQEEIIINLERDYELLKKRFDSLNLQMEEFEKTQSRLLEKFSTQSTQCMKVINLVSELCNEKNSNKSRNFLVSSSTNGIFLKRITVGEEMNSTQGIFLIPNASFTYSTEKPGSVEAPGKNTKKHFTEILGDNNTTAHLKTFENSTQMPSTDREQDKENNISAIFDKRLTEDILEEENEKNTDTGKQTLDAKTVSKGNEDYAELNDSLEEDEDIMTLLLQEEKDQNMESPGDLQTENRNEFIKVLDTASDHRNITKVQERHATQPRAQMMQFSNTKTNVSSKENKTDNTNAMVSKQEAAAQETNKSKAVALKNETSQVKVNAKATNNIYKLFQSMESSHSAKLNSLKQTDSQINSTIPNLVPKPTTNVISAKESDLDTEKRSEKSEKEGYSTRRNDGKIKINTTKHKETAKLPTAEQDIPQALHKENILKRGDKKNNNELNQL